MNRASVVQELAARLSTVLTSAGIAAEDSTGNLKEPLDDALRGLGFAELELETATTDDVLGIITLARYHTLKLALARVSDRFNLSTAGRSLALGTQVDNIRRLVQEAEADVVRLFGSVLGGPVILDLDFLTDTEGWDEFSA